MFLQRLFKFFKFVILFYKSTKDNKIKVIYNGKVFSYSPIKYYNKIRVSLYGNNNSVTIGLPKGNSFINLNVYGNNNFYNQGKDFFGTISCILIGDNNFVKIGDNLGSVYTTIRLHSDRLTIGDNCMFSDDVQIITDGHSIYQVDSLELLNPCGNEIIIGNHVWLNHGVNILKKAQIPDNCIVALDSIVTKKFKHKNSILAGIPAKIVKTGINWNGQVPFLYYKEQNNGNKKITN